MPKLDVPYELKVTPIMNPSFGAWNDPHLLFVVAKFSILPVDCFGSRKVLIKFVWYIVGRYAVVKLVWRSVSAPV